jgi:glycosyltransferase involved in cell wall biosynthesis
VNLHPFLGYRDSLQELLRATALLLYIPSGKNTESVLTGKIFDYLRTGKPVLAIVPPAGLAAELLTKAGIGYIADHQDLPGIAERLMELYWLWENRALGELKVNHDYITQFSRPNLARKLAKLIDAVATGQPAGLPVHTGEEQ